MGLDNRIYMSSRINEINRSKVLEIKKCADEIIAKDELSDSVKLNQFLYLLESLALSIRHTLCSLNSHDKEMPINSYDNLPVSVSFDENALIVKAPLTLKRRDSKSNSVLKENYQLANYLSLALAKWQGDNPTVDLKAHPSFSGGNLILIIIRYDIKFNKNVHCDNDNLENGKILNIMCDALHIGDGCLILDLFSCFRLCDLKEEIGTKFVITKRENLFQYI